MAASSTQLDSEYEDVDSQLDSQEEPIAPIRSTRGKATFPVRVALKSPKKRQNRGAAAKRKRVEGGDADAQTITMDLGPYIGTIVEQVTVLISQNVNAKLDTMLEDLIDTKLDAKVKECTADLRESISTIAKEVEQCHTNGNADVDETINTLTGDVVKLQQQMGQLQKQLDEHVNFTRDKTESLELHGRKLNLVFEGVQHREGENCERIVDGIINREMNLRMGHPTDIAHRLPSNNPRVPPPLIARFRTVAEKSRILQNRAAATKAGIYIRQDLPKSMMERRSYVAKSLDSARKMDPRAKMVRDKLMFNNRLYSAQTIGQAPIKDSYHTVTSESGVKFYGYLSPFSNFYTSSFRLDGHRYACVEQAYQSIKAEQCGDVQGAALIRRERHPIAMKRLGRTNMIDNDIKIRILETAVMAKFAQNSELKKQLVDTGEAEMFECNPYDDLFGTGCRIEDQAINNRSFKGRNEMGNILRRVRASLRAPVL